MKIAFTICLCSLFVISNAQTLFQYDGNGNMTAVKYNGNNACSVTPVPNNKASDIKLFPNPTGNILYAQTNTLDLLIKQIFIYDVAGKLLLVKKYTGTNFIQVDVSKLPTATYTISFATTQNQITFKFIKS